MEDLIIPVYVHICYDCLLIKCLTGNYFRSQKMNKEQTLGKLNYNFLQTIQFLFQQKIELFEEHYEKR